MIVQINRDVVFLKLKKMFIKVESLKVYVLFCIYLFWGF